MATQTDPVCGMQVDERNAAGQSQYQGKAYYFCSSDCETKFDQNPDHYLNKAAGH